MGDVRDQRERRLRPGVAARRVNEVLPPTTYVRPLLGTGFCGAWTTFSSITASTDQLAAHEHAGPPSCTWWAAWL